MNFLIRFARLPRQEKKLFFRALFWFFFYFYILYFQSPKKLKNHFDSTRINMQASITESGYSFAKLIVVTMQRIIYFVPLKNKCLVYALIARKLLCQQHIHNTLYLGMRKFNENWVAHAWLTCGEIDIVGCEEKENYQVIQSFC